MDLLNDVEVRILGCLIEKEMATPEYYPLSLNALTNACNQKTNRHPVVSYDEATVERGMNRLREKKLAALIYASGSRVPKYGHSFIDRYDMSRQEMAVLCELMLRGPQTPGEIRARAERMISIGGIEKVEETLNGLAEMEEPFTMRLPREAGRKESRYVHLLSGLPEMGLKPVEELDERAAGIERIERIEEEMGAIRKEIEELKRAFQEFRSQF